MANIISTVPLASRADNSVSADSSSISSQWSTSSSPEHATPQSYVSRKPVPTSEILAAASSTNETQWRETDSIAQGYSGNLSSWKYEIAACVISVILLMVITVTLHAYDNVPLPQLPFGISLNALVSIYVVLLKASLVLVLATGIAQLKWIWFESDRSLQDLVVFDQASQGVMGSLYFLWHVHVKQAVASLGALLTVVLLATDPFTQQLIQYVSCSEVQTGTASIPRTNFYQTNGFHTGASTVSVTTDIQTAINAAIFGQAAGVNVVCPTGNCTFLEEYSTVGYCSVCEDESHLLEVDVFCFNSSNPESPEMACTAGATRNITTKTPDGAISMVWSSRIGQAGGPHVVANMSTSSLSANPEMAHILVGANDFSLRRISPITGSPLEGCDDPATNDTWRCRGYGAVACDLQPCVQTYEASMERGIFEEKRINQTRPNLSWSADFPPKFDGSPTLGMLDLQCVNDDEIRGLLQAGYIVEPEKRWLPYNITFDPRDAIPQETANRYPESLLAHDCLYLFDYRFVNSLWPMFLDAYFSGSMDAMYMWSHSLVGYSGPQSLQAIYNYADVDFERVDQIFSNISRSMTNVIRQSGNANHSSPMQGTVNHYATCVNVRWGWIAFPTVVVLASLVFCLLTIITTATHHSHVWKSNPLALIYHGPYTAIDTANDTIVEKQSIYPKGIINQDTTTTTRHAESNNDDYIGKMIGPSRVSTASTSAVVQNIAQMESAARNVVVRLDRSDGRLRISDAQVQNRPYYRWWFTK